MDDRTCLLCEFFKLTSIHWGKCSNEFFHRNVRTLWRGSDPTKSKLVKFDLRVRQSFMCAAFMPKV